ncbi:uncharacterized protein LOC132507443 [Lagenorhynchus albirostris]|uniref:uncharacterized protein LOC132507443 n=1 Tax=Lagenorhynchus albirostris TaxID=27610 RepID=UPI0028F1415C|nr:uncharacterized protein LOC132507443 [Lagenorhynchus albirostris]
MDLQVQICGWQLDVIPEPLRSYGVGRPLRLWSPTNGFEFWSDTYQLCSLNPNFFLFKGLIDYVYAKGRWILVNNSELSTYLDGRSNLAALQDVISLLEQSNTFFGAWASRLPTGRKRRGGGRGGSRVPGRRPAWLRVGPGGRARPQLGAALLWSPGVGSGGDASGSRGDGGPRFDPPGRKAALPARESRLLAQLPFLLWPHLQLLAWSAARPRIVSCLRILSCPRILSSRSTELVVSIVHLKCSERGSRFVSASAAHHVSEECHPSVLAFSFIQVPPANLDFFLSIWT